MTNFERYKDIFAEAAADSGLFGLYNGLPILCSKINCDKCDFYKGSSNKSCASQFKKWAEQEHIVTKIPIEVQNLKVDDKVLVSEDGEYWRKRHFHHYDPVTDIVYVFDNGGTSWTEGIFYPWDYAKLPDE